MFDNLPDLSNSPDLSRPSRAGLVYLLRHRELWPDEFKWNWPNPRTCAAGLAAAVWKLGGAGDVARRLSLSGEETEAIFFNDYRTTPETIANALEALGDAPTAKVRLHSLSPGATAALAAAALVMGGQAIALVCILL